MSLNRNNPPEIRIPESVCVPMPSVFVAKNGIKLHAVEAGEQDVVRLSLVFQAGTRLQPRSFLASAAANLLTGGTEKYSAREISEKADFYGASLSADIDRDYAVVSLCCLSKFFPEMLELFEQVVVAPTFPESELEIYKNKRKQQLLIEREKIAFRARELFGEALFGKGHPYGVYYSPDEYDTLKAAGLKAFFKSHYHAGNCFAVSSGRPSEKDRERMLDFLGRIPAGGAVPFVDLPAIRSIRRVDESRPGAVQSALRVGKILFPRSHPDFVGMQVLSSALGGYIGSRLMANLREERGYTYGIFATMVNLEASGYLAIGTEVGAEFTRDALAQIFHEIALLRKEPIGEQELGMVKNMITGEFMRILDGPFGIADVTIENIQNGIGNEYVNRYLKEVREITPARLHALAKKYLKEEGFVTAVVGKPEN
jgi:predicted Zn-dependent peptidase